MAAGTPSYMAPELFKGRSFDLTVDVYAFAVITWEVSEFLSGSRLGAGRGYVFVLGRVLRFLFFEAIQALSGLFCHSCLFK